MTSQYTLTNGKVVLAKAGIGNPVTAIMGNIKKSHPSLDITTSHIEDQMAIYMAQLSSRGLQNPQITKMGIVMIGDRVVAEAEAESESESEAEAEAEVEVEEEEEAEAEAEAGLGEMYKSTAELSFQTSSTTSKNGNSSGDLGTTDSRER